MKLFISPHNDDEALFGAFTILREKPLVLIATESVRQLYKGISAAERRTETLAAMQILQAEVKFLGLRDATLTAELFQVKFREFNREFGPFEHIFAPAFEEDGNADHNEIAKIEFEVPTTRYLTYTKRGKSTSSKMVPFKPEWPLRKLQALACYKSQIREASTRDHFLREQYEYYA